MVPSLLPNTKKRYKAFPFILFYLFVSVIPLSPYYGVHHQLLPGCYKGHIVSISLNGTNELENHMSTVVLDMKSMSNTHCCITLCGYSNISFSESITIVIIKIIFN